MNAPETKRWPSGTACRVERCKGTVWPSKMSRIEELLGHAKGKCDRCSAVFKISGKEEVKS